MKMDLDEGRSTEGLDEGLVPLEENSSDMNNASNFAPKKAENGVSVSGKIRQMLEKLGIPGLLLYNGAKAGVASIGTYVLCPGDVEARVMAASTAGIAMLSGSPTFWAAGTLIAAKIGTKAMKISKSSPKL